VPPPVEKRPGSDLADTTVYQNICFFVRCFDPIHDILNIISVVNYIPGYFQPSFLVKMSAQVPPIVLPFVSDRARKTLDIVSSFNSRYISQHLPTQVAKFVEEECV